jgi:hypothetical protein
LPPAATIGAESQPATLGRGTGNGLLIRYDHQMTTG